MLTIKFFVAVIALAHVSSFGWKNGAIKKFIAPLIISSQLGITSAFATSEDPGSFQAQIKLVQAQQIAEQQSSYDAQELDAINKELRYEEGRLISRGAVILQPPEVDRKAFPLGVKDVQSILDCYPAFANDEATLFILAIGRDGTVPHSAKNTLEY